LYTALPESQQVLKSETYNKFLKESSYWIESYGLFRALKKKNDRKFWGDWPETQTMDKEAYEGKHKDISETPTYKKLLREFAADITFHQFLQLLSHNQLLQA
jgi:4-alpha-glucanotransferase